MYRELSRRVANGRLGGDIYGIYGGGGGCFGCCLLHNDKERREIMKRVLFILLAVAICAMSGCRKTTIIPDDTLADIFHDAFVVNAYIGEERLRLDTLKIYEPIFERYGYTAEDVVYTEGVKVF